MQNATTCVFLIQCLQACASFSCTHFLSSHVSSSADILFSSTTLHIHLAILTSFLYNLITSSSLTGQGSLPDSTTLYKNVNLPFAAEAKHLLVN